MFELIEAHIYQIQSLIVSFLHLIAKLLENFQIASIDPSTKSKEIHFPDQIHNQSFNNDVVSVTCCTLDDAGILEKGMSQKTFSKSVVKGIPQSLIGVLSDLNSLQPYFLIQIISVVIITAILRFFRKRSNRLKDLSINEDEEFVGNIYYKYPHDFICEPLTLISNRLKKSIVVEPNVIGRIPSHSGKVLEATTDDYFIEYQKLDATFPSSSKPEPAESSAVSSLLPMPRLLLCGPSLPSTEVTKNLLDISVSNQAHEEQSSQITTSGSSDLSVLSAIESKISAVGTISKSELLPFNQFNPRQKDDLSKLSQKATDTNVMHAYTNEVKKLPSTTPEGVIELNIHFSDIFESTINMDYKIEVVSKMRFILSSKYDGADESIQQSLSSQVALLESQLASVFQLIIANSSNHTFATELVKLMTDYFRFTEFKVNAKIFFEFMGVLCKLKHLSTEVQVQKLISNCAEETVASLDSENFVIFLSFIDSLVIEEGSNEDIELVLDCLIFCLKSDSEALCFDIDSTASQKLMYSFYLIVSRIANELQKHPGNIDSTAVDYSKNITADLTNLVPKLIDIHLQLKILLLENTAVDKAYREYLLKNYFIPARQHLLQMVKLDSKLSYPLISD